ncbi:neuraminidase-like domain-containing protein [Pseudomonas gozinkensis]|uniref:Tc toxin subunit A-related protein n=1 Tax=Pseudomonas gozinkensis TaxID=2774461 RepID=UPI001787DBE0|nr:neuraminidase-like domain-containing protein [Pseudomonas gozinkensis]
MATIDNIGGLEEKHREALVAYAIGQIRSGGVKKYQFVRTRQDLMELLRLDPEDSHEVQSSPVAEAVSCAQQYISAVYGGQELGFLGCLFDEAHLEEWKFSGNFPDWAGMQELKIYPENVVNPFIRIGKTSLFQNLENDLNQTRLTSESVRTALQTYLEAFVKICNLDVISAFMSGVSPQKAVYYFIGRTRSDPRQYFWREADVELDEQDVATNPAAWKEWRPVDIPSDANVLDLRPVIWNGQLCIVWAVWREGVVREEDSLPEKLDIFLAFKRQDDQWSAPTLLLSRNYEQGTSAAGIRLIATVWSDHTNPKGKLGVLLTNDKTGSGAIRESVVRDLFLRSLPHDNGAWLEEAAKHRFKSADLIQHPLMNQPDVVDKDLISGDLTAYLGLHATAYRVDNKDVLVVRGYCRETGLSGSDVKLTLALQDPGGEDNPSELVGDFPLAGGWSTDSLTFTRTEGSWTLPVITLGSDANGKKKFEVRVTDLTAFPVPSLHKNSLDAAQFLSFNQPGFKLRFIRLNTLNGPELARLATISVDALLDWLTQFLPEKPPSADPSFEDPNGAFDSANGINFWELFFHLPHLVATRLRDEDRFQEALDWFAYLFDPAAPADSDTLSLENPREAYWRCRPLVGPGNPGFEARNSHDPDAICYAKPRHYRILVFCEYVKTLMAMGDRYYRQLTRDSLVAAKLCYARASSLMGKAPTVRAVNRWQAIRLGDLLAANRSRPGLEAFEKSLVFKPGDFPIGTNARVDLELLGSKSFLIPINERLLELFALPGQRLDNLRNNRNIDGAPLQIPLFSPRTKPSELLSALAAGNSGAPRIMGGSLNPFPFRWRVAYETALRASQLLSEISEKVLNLQSSADRAEQEERQQGDLLELGRLAHAMQEQTVEQLRLQVTALEQSMAMAQQRADAFAELYENDVSAAEYQVMQKILLSQIAMLAAASIKPAGAILASLPNIFGLANGGHRAEQITDAVVFGLNTGASILHMDAEKQATTEAYRRRRHDWGMQRDQALAEVSAITAQINAQSQALVAAQTGLEQAALASSQAQVMYNFLKKRATNAELFRWMVGQLKALQRQANDAVCSLCLNARASLDAELGEFDSPNPLPQAWLDNRLGQTSSEHLRLWLLHLERNYIQRYQRRLELRKTISLRKLFDDTVKPQSGIYSWPEALAQLKATGTLEFCLHQLLFDQDHPGHYCRQISTVAVHLPVVKSAYQDVHATLTQIGSVIATKPTGQSVAYLHGDQRDVAPSDIQFNLLAGQSIVLSTGVSDNGLTAQKPDEGLLNPFENSGAVSCWQLKFPWPLKQPQAAVLGSLTDIILEICYTARPGDPTFIRQVVDLVTLAESPEKTTKRKGAGNHG